MHGCPLHTIFGQAGRQPARRVAARRAARRGAAAPGGPPRTGASSAAAGLSRSTEADGAAAYTDDSAPRSRLATLSLCTTTPPPVRAWQPGTAGLLPIPCSIVRHKPTTRAALEPNKPHRSDHIVGPPVCTEVAFSHIRHSRFCRSDGALCDGNSLHCDTQRPTPWFNHIGAKSSSWPVIDREQSERRDFEQYAP
jgi:hypothetical protein